MSIWKELYDIFDKERSRFEKKIANKQYVKFEIQKNSTYLADALQDKIDDKTIIKNLEHSAFDEAIKNGFNFNSLRTAKIKDKDIIGFDEFEKYIGKDTDYLVKNAYSKINSLKKLVLESPDKDFSLKIKSLFRFYVLLVTHIEGRSLVRRVKK